MKKIIILLIVMIVLSLFSGMSINRNWFFIFQFEFIDFPETLRVGQEVSFRNILLWGIVLVAHLGVALLPFFTTNRYFNKLLLWFPLAYLLGYLFLRAEFIILLIPFIIIWGITLRLAKRNVVSHREAI